MKLDAFSKLSTNTLVLHWLVGIMMIGLLATGIYMEENEVIALNGSLAGMGHSIHKYAGIAILIGVILHFAGALKHHIIDKDGTLRRMLGAEI